MSNAKKFKLQFTIKEVLFVAFILRLLLPIAALIVTRDVTAFHRYDTASYLEPARSLLETGQFSSSNQPELFRTPGYPLLLLPGLWLGHGELVTIVLQIFSSCLTVYLLYKIGLLLFKQERIAICCACLYAVEPLSILWSSIIMTEMVHATSITLFLYFILKYLQDKSLKLLVLAAVTLAASTYIRPISYYLPFLITALLLAWTFIKMKGQKILLVHACIFLVVSMGFTGLWQARNYLKTGYSGFAAVSSFNLHCWYGAGVVAAEQGRPVFDVSKELCGLNLADYVRIHPELSHLSQAQVYRQMDAEGKKIIKSNPLLYSKIHLVGMLKTLLSSGGSGYGRVFTNNQAILTDGMFWDYLKSMLTRGSQISTTLNELKQNKLLLSFILNLLGMVILGLYYLLIASSILDKNFVNSLKSLQMIIIIGVASYLLILAGGPPGSHRFRLPMMSIVCLIAGYGLSAIAHRWRRQNELS